LPRNLQFCTSIIFHETWLRLEVHQWHADRHTEVLLWAEENLYTPIVIECGHSCHWEAKQCFVTSL
jgi:hypothetical protein